MNEKKAASCRPKPSLRDRPYLSSEQAGRLEDLFKLLANDTRLRLLHVIAKHEDICVGDLTEIVEMKAPAVSNQLLRLQTAGIVAARREGNNIYYRIVDPCVLILMDRGLCLLEEDERRSVRQPVEAARRTVGRSRPVRNPRS